MRAAAARAARRRGSKRMILPLAQGSAASTNGTRVVLPAPGGATTTNLRFARNASVSPGRTGSIGSGSLKSVATRFLSFCSGPLAPAKARSCHYMRGDPATEKESVNSVAESVADICSRC